MNVFLNAFTMQGIEFHSSSIGWRFLLPFVLPLLLANLSNAFGTSPGSDSVPVAFQFRRCLPSAPLNDAAHEGTRGVARFASQGAAAPIGLSPQSIVS